MNLPALKTQLPATTGKGLAFVRRVEEQVLQVEQIPITTQHIIHAGIYSRTICIPAGVILTGALIKVATTLIVCGKATVLLGDGEEVLVEGYHVFAASAGRKQGFIAHKDTWLTMSFKTNARSIIEVEEEFTDEADMLFSRRWPNITTITGE